ncbi:max dimerization protein 1-like [Adelges cooleyi]|uniref:max dimerization protein 1-like n=1 Tax=Adelges cooleyi TaxID=133065 RepID=UPI0021804526|nr:max dimerization protein 1-like [Adelges cooleyi]
MSIAALLQAAEYLERREREAEHGYASPMPITIDLKGANVKRPKTKKSQGSRTTHNELEKNRRAHLRNCLEKLKEMVPLGHESSRHTTLGLLTKARRFIKNLESQEKKQMIHKDTLSREHRFLRRRLEQLTTTLNVNKRRSVSESSNYTTASGASTTSSACSMSSSSPSISESDEVDVTGWVSDTGSVQSGSSDSGVALSTCRITLSEMVF